MRPRVLVGILTFASAALAGEPADAGPAPTSFHFDKARWRVPRAEALRLYQHENPIALDDGALGVRTQFHGMKCKAFLIFNGTGLAVVDLLFEPTSRKQFEQLKRAVIADLGQPLASVSTPPADDCSGYEEWEFAEGVAVLQPVPADGKRPCRSRLTFTTVKPE